MPFVYNEKLGCRVYDPPLARSYDLQGGMYLARLTECRESLAILFDRWVVENKKKCAVPGEGEILNWQLVAISDTIGLPFAVTCEYLEQLDLLRSPGG